jgi:hypothetical protein
VEAPIPARRHGPDLTGRSHSLRLEGWRNQISQVLKALVELTLLRRTSDSENNDDDDGLCLAPRNVGTRHCYRDQPSFLGQSLYGAVDARHTEPGHLCCASCHTSSAARARSLSSRTPRISRRCWVFRRMAFGDFAALALLGWYLLIPPVFSPMGGHPLSFNDLSARLTGGIYGLHSTRKSVAEKRNSICEPRHKSGRNLVVNTLIRIRMAIS